MALLTGANAWADEITATLDHTVGSSRDGSNVTTTTVDQEYEHYNNTKAAAWGGWAYAQFSFTLPDGVTITSASLKWNTKIGGRSNTRDNDIYYVNAGTTIDYANLTGTTSLNLDGTFITNEKINGPTDRTEKTSDVTTAVAAIAATQNYIIFKWTNNAAGADLFGKGSADYKPVLTITYSEATFYTATFTETNGLTPVVTLYSDAEHTTEVAKNLLSENTTYYYTATLDGYSTYSGRFQVGTSNTTVEYTMTALPRFKFEVNAVSGGTTIKNIYTDEDSYEGKSHNIEYQKYLTGENNIVTHQKANDTYGESIVAKGENEVITVEYNTYDGIAYFVEAEDVITNATPTENMNYSNGHAVRGFDTAKDIFTVPTTGIYDVTYAACNNNVNYALSVTLSKDDTEIATKDNLQSVSFNKIKTEGIISNSNISLTAGEVLKLRPSDTRGIIDYMLVELKSHANYTINYVYNGETIKEVTGTEMVGSDVTAENPITINGQKYFAVNGASTSMTIASGANKLNVELRQAAIYSYSVRAAEYNMHGGNKYIKQITAGSVFEGDEVPPFAFPQYIMVDGKKLFEQSNPSTGSYIDNPGNVGNYKHGGYIPRGDGDYMFIFYAYAKDVLWFSEGEDVAGGTPNSEDDTDIRCSMGAGALFSSATELVTLPAGTYKLTAQIWGHSGTNFTFKAGNTQIGETTTFSTNGTLHTNSAEFTLTEATTITVEGGASGKVIDWIYITTEDKVIGAIDYSTAFMDDVYWMSIKPGQSLNLDFTNHGGSEQSFNWLVRLTGTEGVDHTLRADNYVTNDVESTVSTRSITENGGAINWDDFKADMKNAEVSMTIKYSMNGMFSIEATTTAGDNTYNYTFAYNDAKSGDIYVGLGVEKAWLALKKEEYNTLDEVVPITITSAGWATLYSDFALDFSAIEGLTAYTATYDGEKVTLTQVSNVPARTGVVLKGAAKAYEIPAIASSSTDKGQLKGSTTESKAYDENSETDVYILVLNGQGEAQFTKMTSGEVAAGKGYLEIAKSSGSGEARLSVVFEGEGATTGISGIEGTQLQSNDAVYSLSGQRVATPKKGLYIVNGKKKIIK